MISCPTSQASLGDPSKFETGCRSVAVYLMRSEADELFRSGSTCNNLEILRIQPCQARNPASCMFLISAGRQPAEIGLLCCFSTKYFELLTSQEMA